MFDIGLQEMLVIGVLALLVFGPSRLPELGRMFGRAMREFRRASDEFRTTVETNLHINDPDPMPSPPASASADPFAGAASVEVGADRVVAQPGDTPEGSTTAAVLEPPSGEPYCAQRGARLFHRRECGWVTRIPEVERVYLKRMVDAREQGFTTCPVCEPWEPDS